MNTKIYIVALVAILVIAIGGYSYPGVQTKVREVVKEVKVGANAGPSFFNPLDFRGGVTYGSTNSTTTVASMTLRVADIKDFDTVIVRPTGAAAAKTLTLFASSTASHWLPKAGDRQVTCFLNATTTAGVNLVFAAGTGIDLQTASSTITDLTLSPDNTACFTFARKAQVAGVTNSFDIEASMVEYNDGD